MRFATPVGLAAAALAGPLVLWYVLRSRRPRLEVSSTFLWERADRPVSAAVPWQRFRPDRTFWLVLAAVLAGALALGRPAVPVAAELGDHTIVVIDVSASMLADEDGPTRLELARRQAEALVADLAPGQVASVIEASVTARVLLSASPDGGALRSAIRSVRPAQGSADLADAFTLAAALHRPGHDTVVHLLTDGPVPAEAAGSVPQGLRVHAVGSDRPNLAVTRLEAVATGAGSAQVFAQVRNFGLLDSAGRLSITVDGVEVARRRLDLPARGSEDVVLPVSDARPGAGRRDAAAAGIVQATVRAAGETPFGEPSLDALPLDDVAYATLAGARQLDVVVAGPGNVFLEAALESIDGVRLRSEPAVPERLVGVDVLVIDRLAAPPRPHVPTVYVAPSTNPDGIVAEAPAELPAITFQAPAHALLADVDLSGVAVAEARPVAAPALETVVGGPSGALVLAGRLDGAPVVYLAFDLLASNLPLQVAWPVLVANAVQWLSPPPASSPLTVGQEAAFTVPPGATGVVVQPPGGEPVRLDAARPRVAVDRIGVWTARWAGPEDALAAAPAPAPLPVNLPLGESDLTGDRPAAQAGAGTGGSGDTATREGLRVFGRGLLAVVLALLLAEWVIAQSWRGAGRRRRWRPGGRAGPTRARAPAPSGGAG